MPLPPPPLGPRPPAARTHRHGQACWAACSTAADRSWCRATRATSLSIIGWPRIVAVASVTSASCTTTATTTTARQGVAKKKPAGFACQRAALRLRWARRIWRSAVGQDGPPSSISCFASRLPSAVARSPRLCRSSASRPCLTSSARAARRWGWAASCERRESNISWKLPPSAEWAVRTTRPGAAAPPPNALRHARRRQTPLP